MPQVDDDLCYMQAAFDKVCGEVQQAGQWYVALMESRPWYGGPEEGGWWGTDRILVAYKKCETEEEAEGLKTAIEEMAAELTTEARHAEGELCLRQMEMLDSKGLDADFLPENDGASEFFVTVTEGLPASAYGQRGYS